MEAGEQRPSSDALGVREADGVKPSRAKPSGRSAMLWRAKHGPSSDPALETRDSVIDPTDAMDPDRDSLVCGESDPHDTGCCSGVRMCSLERLRSTVPLAPDLGRP